MATPVTKIPALAAKMEHSPYITSNFGQPLPSNDQTLTAGVRGVTLLQDTPLIEKLAHFDRERVPERVAHANGTGAFGYFESTVDMSEHTKAVVFQGGNKRTPVFMRLSTVILERGSSDAERDPRGFAIKFYTEDGNYDLVCNNTPVFFIRDPMKFPDLIHSQKRNPRSGLRDNDAYWDFVSLSPEATHMVTMLFSDRGTPRNFRTIHGFGIHTFVWVNADNKPCYVKYHFLTETGIDNWEDGIEGVHPDHATADLFHHLESGKVASWKACVQIMPIEEATKYRYDPFDSTKVWLHKDYPMIEIGRLVLDRNPSNNYAEVEQSAFSPSTMIPGIQPSTDKLLQGRLFSYPDTQRHRLGGNYALIPVNCPFMQAKKFNNYQRDGPMRTDGNFAHATAHYYPNSHGGGGGHGAGADFDLTQDVGAVPAGSTFAPALDPLARMMEVDLNLNGRTVREDYPAEKPNSELADDYEQAGLLYRLLDEGAKNRLVKNIAGHLGLARKSVQLRQIEHFRKADPDYGSRVETALRST